MLKVTGALRKYWFHITLIILVTLPIILLLCLDYYNMEGYNYAFNSETGVFEDMHNSFFNDKFVFELTWKGRLFLLVFLWIFVIESAMDWKKFTDEKPTNRYLMIASLVCALIPLIYVVSVQFLGLDVTVLSIGRDVFGIGVSGAPNESLEFLSYQWPVSCEYIVFTMFFSLAILFAYKLKGLKTLSISLALLAGIGFAYLFDTIFPFGVFKPLAAFAVPTTAVAAALFELLGYSVTMVYPIRSAGSALPSLTVHAGGETASVAVAWACAGVQSLMLFTLIILVFFKKSDLSAFRKLAYFIIGAFGTFFVNVLRVYSIVMVMLYEGRAAGMDFHDVYGELYAIIWILAYILVIGLIQRFMLVERVQSAFHRVYSYLGNSANKLFSRSETAEDTASSDG
jgi:exosortase/archaeosortase family protein